MLISYSYSSKNRMPAVPSRPVPAAMASTLRYYSSDIHKVTYTILYYYVYTCIVLYTLISVYVLNICQYVIYS